MSRAGTADQWLSFLGAGGAEEMGSAPPPARLRDSCRRRSWSCLVDLHKPALVCPSSNGTSHPGACCPAVFLMGLPEDSRSLPFPSIGVGCEDPWMAAGDGERSFLEPHAQSSPHSCSPVPHAGGGQLGRIQRLESTRHSPSFQCSVSPGKTRQWAGREGTCHLSMSLQPLKGNPEACWPPSQDEPASQCHVLTSEHCFRRPCLQLQEGRGQPRSKPGETHTFQSP